MPFKAKHPCNKIGCRELTDGRFCATHHKQREYGRGTAHQRGYNTRWRKYRMWYIKEHPLCAQCQDNGKITPTYAVDHIVPHRGDYDLFWNEDNHQPLCEHHHNSKTGRGE
jgi:5-methylcytosine-specific restriction protein A